MNRSGMSVQTVASFYKIIPADIWVVHDDIDLPVGKMRIRIGGASAGHHGIDSLINNLPDAGFVRFRLGIGRGKLDKPHTADHNLPRHEVEKYVVSLFRDSEAGEVKKMVKKASDALEFSLKNGVGKAMNLYN